VRGLIPVGALIVCKEKQPATGNCDTLKTVTTHPIQTIWQAYLSEQAAPLDLKNVTFEKADAFDLASYRLLATRPNIAIISGLFELFPDNAPVRQCLKGIATAMEDSGYLIYTGQPWHPQIEMIARVLKNRDGQLWVMRRRTQRELDDLVRQAGFEKIGTEVGGRGIFTVSIAQRRNDLQESN
jgi:hypothetical protein